jgi:hypothetical protein
VDDLHLTGLAGRRATAGGGARRHSASNRRSIARGQTRTASGAVADANSDSRAQLRAGPSRPRRLAVGRTAGANPCPAAGGITDERASARRASGADGGGDRGPAAHSRDGLTVRAVAAQAGGGKSLAGHHFGSRAGLLAASATELLAVPTPKAAEPRERWNDQEPLWRKTFRPPSAPSYHRRAQEALQQHRDAQAARNMRPTCAPQSSGSTWPMARSKAH